MKSQSNNHKKGFILVLSIIAVLNLICINVHAIVEFPDVDKAAWYKADLNYVLDDSRQIIAGYPDGTYKPQNTLTADQFITCIVKASYYTNLPENKEYWAKPFIDKSIELGYVKNGEFAAYNKPITRGEMARIVVRAINSITGAHEFRDAEKIKMLIGDYDSIPNELKEFVVKTYDMGIINGYPNGTFKAGNILTRAEAAVVIRKTIDKNSRTSPKLPSGNVEIVEGIQFDRVNDVVEPEGTVDDGSMKLDKQQEFVEKLFKSIKVSKVGNKNYIEGYVPNLPAGYKWNVQIVINYKNGKGDYFYVGDSGRPEIRMYTGKTFKFELSGGKEQLEYFGASAWVAKNAGGEDGRFFLNFSKKEFKKQSPDIMDTIPFNWEALFQW